MNWDELTKPLTVLLEVATAVLGVLVWRWAAHAQQLKDQLGTMRQGHELEKARREQEEAANARLTARLETAETDRVGLRARVAVLERDAGAAASKLTDVQKVSRHNYDAAHKQYDLRREAERREADARQRLESAEAERNRAVASEAVVTQRVTELTAERDKFADTARRKARRVGGLRKQLKALEQQANAVAKQDGRVWLKPVAAGTTAFVPLAARRTPIISVVNLKGGVGKTTVTANLSGLFGLAQKRVLMLDLDHQRSLSQMLLPGRERELLFQAKRSVQHLLESEAADGAALVTAAAPVGGAAGCSVVINGDPADGGPAAGSLDDVEMTLMGRWLARHPDPPDVRFLLRGALHAAAVREAFDYVLLDCPPRLTTACVNALAASDFVLIPVQPDPVSLRSVVHLLMRLKALQTAGVAPFLRILGVVANMVPDRALKADSLERTMLDATKTHAEREWGGPVPFCGHMLLRLTQYADAARQMDAGGGLRLAIDFPKVHRAFEELAKELEGRIHDGVRVAGVPA
jgi:cellulose biosynthesis protein BcsQ